MLDKVQVNIEMDQTWTFWPHLEEGKSAKLELDSAFFLEFSNVSKRYFEMAQQLEALFALQRGKPVPYPGLDLPPHRVISQDVNRSEVYKPKTTE